MSQALVAIGCNLGDRREQIATALDLLRATPGVVVEAVSRLRETSPVGGPAGQGAFLNGALRLDTALAPEALRQALGRVELALGRQRDIRWQARLLDLDLLLYDQLVISTPTLVVPHPRMAFRRFVLEPAVEIASNWMHPLIGWTLADLLKHLDIAWPYVAITGVAGLGKTRLAAHLAEAFQGALIAPSAAGPASRDLAREIEFLESRFEWIEERRFPREAPFAVSDFWFPQSLAYAKRQLAEEDFNRLQTTVARMSYCVVAPKLRVILTAGGERGRVTIAMPGDEREEIQDAICRLANRPGVGPIMQLPADDPESAFAEASAAIEAMR